MFFFLVTHSTFSKYMCFFHNHVQWRRKFLYCVYYTKWVVYLPYPQFHKPNIVLLITQTVTCKYSFLMAISNVDKYLLIVHDY